MAVVRFLDVLEKNSHLSKARKRAEAKACLERASQIASGLDDTEWAQLLMAKASTPK